MMRNSLVFGTVVVGCGLASTCFGQQPTQDGAAFIEKVVENRFEKQGGSASEVWKQPWRFVILFNSAQASSKSAYTKAALESIVNFLSRRESDGQPHRISFYPYQLDLYRDKAQVVEDQPLGPDSLSQIEKVFPRIPYKFLSDNMTPYALNSGGHNNFGARQTASDIVGISKTPTLILQISDAIISEAPKSPTDPDVRDSDQRPRGTEKAALVFYEAPSSTLKTTEPSQTYTISIYGPKEFEIVKSKSGLVPILLGLLVLGGLAFLVRMFMKSGGISAPSGGNSWNVTLPGSAAIVVSKKEPGLIIGSGGELPTGQNYVVFSAENAPKGKLMELYWDKSGVKIKDHLWKITVASGTNPVIVKEDVTLYCEDTVSGARRNINVRINSNS